MRKMTLIMIALFAFTQGLPAAEIEITSMECEVSNLMGYKIGSATLKGAEILIDYGIAGNLLWINQVSEDSIVAMTKGQSWDYTFAFDEKFDLDLNEYEGTLYQQYVMGYGGPKMPIASLHCQVLF